MGAAAGSRAETETTPQVSEAPICETGYADPVETHLHVELDGLHTRIYDDAEEGNS